jgi:hypothetical protein
VWSEIRIRASSIGFIRFVSFANVIQVTGLLTFALMRLRQTGAANESDGNDDGPIEIRWLDQPE